MDSNELQSQFSQPLLNWFSIYGRKNLPWQHPRIAYRVWISEIMLQQTQVQTVIPFFERFMTSFPDVWQLAAASEDAVLAHWSGLGYYSRARNIHKTANIICEHYSGHFPDNLASLVSLPGIGDSTAAAIASLAFNKPTAILDGNVKRVLSRYFMVDGSPEQSLVKKRLWQIAQQCMPVENCAEYTQAIMDLGATCCTLKNPDCHNCPLKNTCQAFLHDKVAQYPFKAVKKIRPIKHQQFLLMHTEDNLIYLERKPAGLWGGLWCMPAINMEADPAAFILENYGFECVAINKLMALKHSFTHFHLHVTAQAASIVSNTGMTAEHPGKWFAANQFNTVGLAKPVAQILANFLQIVA